MAISVLSAEIFASYRYHSIMHVLCFLCTGDDQSVQQSPLHSSPAHRGKRDLWRC
jgi:hypothetical protein